MGGSASLTMMELCAANDLNNMVPSPYDGFEPVRPLSPEVFKGIPAGAESDRDSLGVEGNSGDEWDKKELGVWSHCPTPTTKVGPTWVEVHAAAQEQEMLNIQNMTWEEIVSKQLPGGMEGEDWDKEDDDQPTLGSQFEDTPIAAEASKEEIMEESVMGETPIKHVDEATVGPGSQDVVQIHVGRMTCNKHVPPCMQLHQIKKKPRN